MSTHTSRIAAPGIVELQLLRHGPAHNQLLSPLTEYLALVGDHSNTTLRIPLEHAALMTRLRALGYGDSDATRADQIRDIARIASQILSTVPGLIADLSCNCCDGRPLVHLSIASRASELALFPFELALAPDGFPGEGQPLCLQTKLPICLTRRSRNIRNDRFRWDTEVRILMIASDAGGEIPLTQHYALLRKLVEPWVGIIQSDTVEQKKSKLNKVLKLIDKASIRKVEQCLQNESFTHIHVLAHGCPLSDEDRRYGIALHDPDSPDRIDVINGARLAKALGRRPAGRTESCPSVVSLATCESAQQGGVTSTGSSLAFELHDAGVPLVIGSQFPLSFGGSIIMTESLYRGFLEGHDPRMTVWETRRALLAGLPEQFDVQSAGPKAPHDWASLTVYAAFPKNLDRVLPRHRRNRQVQRINRHLKNLETLISRGDHSSDIREETRAIVEESKNVVVEFSDWVKRHDYGNRNHRITSRGILAAAQKKVGLACLSCIPEKERRAAQTSRANKSAQDLELVWEQLRHARQTYWSVFDFARDEIWALVQFLVLDAVLNGTFDRELWATAKNVSLLDRNSSNLRLRVWALSNLIELQFLRLMQPNSVPASWAGAGTDGGGDPKRLATEYSRELRALSNRLPWEVYCAKCQFDRFHLFFCQEPFPGCSGAPRDKVVAAIKSMIRPFEDLDFSAFEKDGS